MTLKNNRASLLCYFKFCASFSSHWWIQTGVTVRKRPIWVKIDDFFSRVTLKFDRWPWKTLNRVPLLSNIKLCASFHHHMWIQTGVSVRKPLSWVLTSMTLTFGLWPWPFAWTSLLSLVKTPENFMMIRWWEHSQKGVKDRRTNIQTDRQTDGMNAWSQLKIILTCRRVSCVSMHIGISGLRTVAWHLLHNAEFCPGFHNGDPWASYQIRKIAGCACAGNAGNVFSRHRVLAIPTCNAARALRTCRNACRDH